jgi:hypothetical protein
VSPQASLKDQQWRPVFPALCEAEQIEVLLVNARHVKNVPGRKTGVATAGVGLRPGESRKASAMVHTVPRRFFGEAARGGTEDCRNLGCPAPGPSPRNDQYGGHERGGHRCGRSAHHFSLGSAR